MDRLKELKQGSQGNKKNSGEKEEDERELISLNDIELAQDIPLYTPRKDNPQLNLFFENIDSLKKYLEIIKKSTKEIQNQSKIILQSSSASEKETKASQAMEETIITTDKIVRECKKLVQALQKEVKDTGGGGGGEGKKSSKSQQKQLKESPEDQQLKINALMILIRQFVSLMKDYQNSQTIHQIEMKKKFKRQIKVIQPQITDEEIETLIKSGQGNNSSMIYKDVILKGSANEIISNAYYHAENKYQDVLALEASINELHQMFIDLSHLTLTQGEHLDKIEKHVQQAGEDVDVANSDLVISISILQSIQCKRCCCALTVLVIVGVIVGLVVAKVKGGL